LAGPTESNDISRRYARACFALAEEGKQVDALAADLAAVQKMLAESADLRQFLTNATLSRADQEKALAALGAKAKFSTLTQKLLGTLAQKRRLPALPGVIAALQSEIAARKGEVTAEVTAAHELEARQVEALSATLKKALGKEVRVEVRIDPSILGGIIVRVGSQLIDSSVRSKLERLHRALKTQNSSQGKKKIREVA